MRDWYRRWCGGTTENEVEVSGECATVRRPGSLSLFSSLPPMPLSPDEEQRTVRKFASLDFVSTVKHIRYASTTTVHLPF